MSHLTFRTVFRYLAVCLFVLAAYASSRAAGEWVQVRSANFTVIGDAGERELRMTASRLEQFREAIRSLFPQVKLDGGIRTNVVVFKNAAAYAPFKPKRSDGSVDEIVRGYFQAGEDVNYIALAAGERPGAYDTIYHEYVHFLLDVNIGRTDLPPWLGEGLAEYLETMQVFPEGRVVLGTPPPGHMAMLRRSEFLPFTSLFGTDNAALHRTGDESRTLFYAQSWALTHYLLHGKRGGRETKFEDLLTRARDAETPEKFVEQLFRSDDATLAKSLRDHLDQPSLPTRLVQLVSQSVVLAEPTAAPLSEAQTAAYLGDLLYHTHRSEEAETYLRRALKLDPDLGIANSSMGLLLVRNREFAAAKRYLEKAAATDKTNHFAYFNYAYALSRENTDDTGWVSQFPPLTAAKMRESLLRAIELNPGFGESYRLLAFVNLVNNINLEEAISLLKKGLEVSPGDQELTSMLAQVYLRQEKYDEARAIARKLASAATTPEVWKDAMEVLQTVDQYYAVKTTGPADPAAAKVFGPIPPLILKRSRLTDEEVARYEEDRQVTNLNLSIQKPRFGQKQVVGRIEKIACANGEITYSVRSGGESFTLSSIGFGSIGLRVLTEGESSFTLDCGASFAKNLTVLTYQPSAGTRKVGRLVSISFVPDYFRLKTPEEMARHRTVIIEDDRPDRTRSARPSRSDNPQN